MRTLVIEDDFKMATLLKRGLEQQRHTVLTARTGPEGLDLALNYFFDAIVLDVMIPGFDGFEVSRRLRAAGNATPILFLTARDTENDVVQGLDSGGDDYLTKPFSFREFAARLRALARRAPRLAGLTLRTADLELNPTTHRVTRAGRTIVLTKTEYSLLEYMLRHTGKVLTRDALIDAVWGLREQVGDNTLDTFIKLLRHKIDAEYQPKLIRTIRGFGYQLSAGEES
jgi:DNA-binding response OmpR family regulator